MHTVKIYRQPARWLVIQYIYFIYRTVSLVFLRFVHECAAIQLSKTHNKRVGSKKDEVIKSD